MIRLFVGVAIGIALCVYFPKEVSQARDKAGELIHEGAAKAAEATKPKSKFDEMLDRVTDPLKGN